MDLKASSVPRALRQNLDKDMCLDNLQSLLKASLVSNTIDTDFATGKTKLIAASCFSGEMQVCFFPLANNASLFFPQKEYNLARQSETPRYSSETRYLIVNFLHEVSILFSFSKFISEIRGAVVTISQLLEKPI